VKAQAVLSSVPYLRVTLAPGMMSHDSLLLKNGTVAGAFIQYV